MPKSTIGKTLETHAQSVKCIENLQKCVNELRKDNYFAPYLKQHRLEYIDSRFIVLDKMLDSGLLRA